MYSWQEHKLTKKTFALLIAVTPLDPIYTLIMPGITRVKANYYLIIKFLLAVYCVSTRTIYRPQVLSWSISAWSTWHRGCSTWFGSASTTTTQNVSVSQPSWTNSLPWQSTRSRCTPQFKPKSGAAWVRWVFHHLKYKKVIVLCHTFWVFEMKQPPQIIHF